MQARLETNSAMILAGMLEKNLTIDSAAQRTGLSRATLTKAVSRDSTVSYSTAAKFRKVFGLDAIRILPPKRELEVTR